MSELYIQYTITYELMVGSERIFFLTVQNSFLYPIGNITTVISRAFRNEVPHKDIFDWILSASFSKFICFIIFKGAKTILRFI